MNPGLVHSRNRSSTILVLRRVFSHKRSRNHFVLSLGLAPKQGDANQTRQGTFDI